MALLVSVHRFNPRPEGFCALVLVGRDAEGAFAALVALDRRGRPLERELVPGARVVALACLAHELAASAIMACADAIDPISAVAQVNLTIAAGRVWSISMETVGPFDGRLAGPEVAVVRGPSVEVLRRAAGWTVGTATAAIEQAVPS